jgi:hypothetical protein
MAINTNVSNAAINNVGTQISNFIPSVWSKKILDKLQLECKLVDNCWQEYEGDVQHASAVHILGIGEVVIDDYTGMKGEGIEYKQVTDAGQTLVIDQAKVFALMFDDVERAQTMPGLWEGTNEEAVHQLACARDSYVALKIKEGTNVTTATNLTTEAVKKAIDDGLVALKKRNYNGKADIELSPEAAMCFLNALTVVSTDNPEYIKKGVIGFYHGHKVVESNNMATDSTHSYCAIRDKKAIAFAGQVNKVEALRLEKYFADAVRGLDVYGAKVIDDNRMQVIKIPLTATA